MAQPPMIVHGGNSAFYSPTMDAINLPEVETFKSQPEYYATKLHEVTHSTGHPSRLNRFKESESGIFGSETYSAEELVAEMCAASLVAFCGMVAPVANSAAYLRSWATRLRKDPKQIMGAAKRAEAAYDYLTAQPAETEEGEAE
jgi:antirestriction protein ArdC